MMKFDFTEFVRERDYAMIEAVNNDNWEAVKTYCKKYEVPMPDDERIMKAGIYKAVQLTTSIPESVKEKAFVKCLELGFSPLPVPIVKEKKKNQKKS